MVATHQPSWGSSTTWSAQAVKPLSGFESQVPAGTPTQWPSASTPRRTASNTQCGPSGHLRVSTRTLLTSWRLLLLRDHSRRAPGDDVLVRRTSELRGVVDDVRVEADQHPGLALDRAVEDDPGGLLGGHPGELLLEQVVDLGGVLAGGLATVAGDPGLDAARVDAGDRDRVLVDQHLL